MIKIIIIIWNLWATYLLYLYMYLKLLLRKHIDIKTLDLEASSRRSSCKILKLKSLKFTGLLQRGSSKLALFFGDIAVCILEDCNFIKALVYHSLFSQNIFLRQLVLGTYSKNSQYSIASSTAMGTQRNVYGHQKKCPQKMIKRIFFINL